MFKLRTLLLPLLLSVMAGCLSQVIRAENANATLPVVGALQDSTVEMSTDAKLPHFSFSAPEDDAWVEEQILNKGKTVFTARRGAVVYRITLLESSILDEKMRKASAKDVADDFRNSEKNDMIERGVKRGLYELSDLIMGQETIGGKLYFTMKGSTSVQGGVQSGGLYLYFPSEYDNNYFLIAHYSEATRSGDLPTFSFESEFLDVLQSVIHTPAIAIAIEADKTAHGRVFQENHEDYIAFFPKAYPVTQIPITGLRELEIRCQKRVAMRYVSFVGFGEGYIFLVVITKHEFEAPAINLIDVAPDNVIPPGGTMDWGYVFDRNHDGKVDYLAFLDGANLVVPDDWTGDLPDQSTTFTEETFKELVLPNMKLLFWHLADDNFDGYHDGTAVSTRNVESGWIDGWIAARDTDFDGNYDSCNYFQGRFRTDVGPCEGTPSSYRVPNKELSGIRQIPPSKDFYFQLINAAAEKCNFSGESFYRGER